jgi:hypothetical protein
LTEEQLRAVVEELIQNASAGKATSLPVVEKRHYKKRRERAAGSKEPAAGDEHPPAFSPKKQKPGRGRFFCVGCDLPTPIRHKKIVNGDPLCKTCAAKLA